MRCVCGGSKALLAAPWGWNCHLQRERQRQGQSKFPFKVVVQCVPKVSASGFKSLVCTLVPKEGHPVPRHLPACLVNGR